VTRRAANTGSDHRNQFTQPIGGAPPHGPHRGYNTSLLFACIHTSVWPTPVPLFVLALGLGVLAQRTRSLVGPIVLHGLFNGISCVQLLWRL
jgi:hypothetical protein